MQHSSLPHTDFAHDNLYMEGVMVSCNIIPLTTSKIRLTKDYGFAPHSLHTFELRATKCFL